MASIRGGAQLKKVSDAEKRDRSAAAVPGAEPAAPPPPAAGGGGGGGEQGGLAGALASALAARKSKVSHSGKCSLPFFHFCSAVSFGLSLLLGQMMRRMMMIGKRMSIAGMYVLLSHSKDLKKAVELFNSGVGQDEGGETW